MNDEIKEILDDLLFTTLPNVSVKLNEEKINQLKDYITNLQQEINKLTAESTEWESKYYDLQQENKIKDTNWESLKYYLEKLYYKDYIEEAISDDIDKKIKELESKVEIKGYQKDIKALQQENERLKEANVYCNRTDCVGRIKDSRKYDSVYQEKEDYKSRCEKAYEELTYMSSSDYVKDYDIKQNCWIKLSNILQNGSDEE